MNSINYSPQQLNEYYDWLYKRKCAPPAPHFVKQQVLIRHSVDSANWVETGTLYGTTTQFLAEQFVSVATIEPSDKCINIAKNNLANYTNVSIYHGTSETYFEQACSQFQNKHLCCWLDAHWSMGDTYKGKLETSVMHELKTISKIKSKFSSVTVFIDDLRLSFRNKDYPSLNIYANWAIMNDFVWSIEHDIFIAKPYGSTFYEKD